MKKLYKSVLLILSCLLVQNIVAQRSITFQTAGLNVGDTCLLYFYKNGMPVLLDKAIVDKPEIIILKDTMNVVEGLYMVMLPKVISPNPISVLYSKKEKKNIDVQYFENNENVIFKDSEQNNAYAAYIKQAEKFYSNQHQLEEDFLNENDSIERKKIRNKAISEQQLLYDYGKRIASAFEGTIVEKLIDCTNTLPIPDMAWSGEHLLYDIDDVKYQKSVDFIKLHYWEGVDFKSNVLTNTPYLGGKTTNYISSFNLKDKKNILLAIEDLLQKASVNPDMYRVIEEALLNLYLIKSSPFFNEEIGVYILKNEQKTSFTPDWRKELINAKISFIEKNKQGSIAAELPLQDPKGIKKSILKSKAKYTILYFFNPECSHCMEVTPILKEWLEKKAPKELQLFAIYIENDEKVWHEFVSKNTFQNNWLNVWGNKEFVQIRTEYWIDNIPSIYLLDESKKVILKDVNYKQLIDYF
ncbi:thioredoxin-like domain-containing protein [Flavobacterium sp. KACC 22761]|uniref:thioredoxin-like domain-containing protein n=1 Tax=Flavobacterium sp. KACC 22761 TaxID=3092665 RepID=UPI002A76466B|nr:thioredoxin-like domain-containing protein [Flavobacterium sp. KACC 22761]WPO78477.1 thioredoxin-like domain-containing protein [Flavobacterium sp. KACC 22761]